MKKTLEQIIDDFKNKHGDKFDYKGCGIVTGKQIGRAHV